MAGLHITPMGRESNVVLSMMETLTVELEEGMLRGGGGWGAAMGWEAIVPSFCGGKWSELVYIFDRSIESIEF